MVWTPGMEWIDVNFKTLRDWDEKNRFGLLSFSIYCHLMLIIYFFL